MVEEGGGRSRSVDDFVENAGGGKWRSSIIRSNEEAAAEISPSTADPSES